jgi:23S rRNA pseudouridine955/2504/2580 synthase
MAALKNITVGAGDEGLRLDRWFKTHYPTVGHGELQKLLRTGQVRVDGKRAKAGLRLCQGMEVRVPPQVRSPDAAKLRRGEGGKAATRTRAKPLILTPEDVADLRRRVIYRDDDVIVLDKPAGLAVQGGTATHRHLDGMLDALTFRAAERPRLVHRLDKDTSGVLVLARNREAARTLTGAFRSRETRKLYLCVTAGCPKPRRGQVSLALAKGGAPGEERMSADVDDGARAAVTLYDTLDTAGTRAALVALMPLTGRTHQLRAHMAAIGTPVLGDGKYGGSKAFISGQGLEQRLHLHARTIEIPKPGGGILRATAPLPPHLETALAGFAFEIPDNEDTFPRD